MGCRTCQRGQGAFRPLVYALVGIDLVVLDDFGEHPLKHAKLLTEVQSYREASGARWMNMIIWTPEDGIIMMFKNPQSFVHQLLV